ncbi:MAG TPA: hypothetical protein PK500_01190 [Candidatus Egerieousia sp.]|nr:hypothetical protein [Candidatus Egerieousia sp.]HPT05254.1 hypothetical protein [Candidatus Egerieousia sp.]
MDFITNLSGRLRNIKLPYNDALFPLFEAIVNSIHSIDERIEKNKDISMNDAVIKVSIVRSAQGTISGEKSEITGFTIEDNGIGFTDDNFTSFKTLDSDYKINKGCRGVGRLLWLKAFSSVNIDSVYVVNNKHYRRTFYLTSSKIIIDKDAINSPNDNIKTLVELQYIKKEYLKYIPKSSLVIGRYVLEHCLWYFLRVGSAPNITIDDNGDGIALNRIFEDYMANESKTESFTLKGSSFDLTHVKYKVNSNNKNCIMYSAANRLVKIEQIKGVPGLFGALKDGDEDFYYMCFVCSQYLTDNVLPERFDFSIPEDRSGIYEDTDISFSDIRTSIINCINTYLGPYLKDNREAGKKTLDDYVSNEAPRYRPILNRLSEDERIVDPNISKKELDLKMHKHLVDMEEEILSEGHDLLKPSNIYDEETYSKKLDEYLVKVVDLKKSDLANYVTHRKVVLEMFEKALQKQSNGEYFREEVIHKLIMPMITTSDQALSDDCNLWIVDERLAFHNYLASDKPLSSMKITDNASIKEPDVLALNVYDNPLLVSERQTMPLASITILELKRPMRNDAAEGEDKDPIEQTLGYLNKVREGKMKTALGRQIPNSSDIPGFCYILCDLTPSMVERCKMKGFTQTYDKLAYFGFNAPYGAYVEVISFDRLLQGAKERNKAFFDKLGLPTD